MQRRCTRNPLPSPKNSASAMQPVPVDGILGYCRRRIDGWVAEAGGVSNIDALESLVTQRLQMVFEEIRSDDDFDSHQGAVRQGRRKTSCSRGCEVPRFDDAENPTFGAAGAEGGTPATTPRIASVAVIDCRAGPSWPARFFTRWHEIAHRLTTQPPTSATDQPVYRSEQDPIERMMDEIAGHVGFYEPLFQPAYSAGGSASWQAESAADVRHGRGDHQREDGFPEASFQATLFNACTSADCRRRWSTLRRGRWATRSNQT